MYICTFIVLITKENGYIFAFYILPLLDFIENESILNKNNIVEFILLMLVILPIPILALYFRLLYNIVVLVFITAFSIVKTLRGVIHEKNINNGSML